jgi:hypothetical protein
MGDFHSYSLEGSIRMDSSWSGRTALRVVKDLLVNVDPRFLFICFGLLIIIGHHISSKTHHPKKKSTRFFYSGLTWGWNHLRVGPYFRWVNYSDLPTWNGGVDNDHQEKIGKSWRYIIINRTHMVLMWQHNAGIWCTRSSGKKGTNGQRSQWVKQEVGVDTFWATVIPNIFFSRASWIVKLLDNGRRRFRCPSCEKLKSGWVSLNIWKFFNPRDVRHPFSLVSLFHFFNSNLVPWSTFLTFPIKLYQMLKPASSPINLPFFHPFFSIFQVASTWSLVSPGRGLPVLGLHELASGIRPHVAHLRSGARVQGAAGTPRAGWFGIPILGKPPTKKIVDEVSE